MTDILCEFQSVYKRFGDLEVLRGINLTIRSGEVVVLCGPSGAGKSTLIRCINYLEPIQSGTVLVDGEPVNKETAGKIRKEIGMVFQHFELFPHMTVLDNCTLGLRKVHRVDRSEAEARVLTLLERVGIPDKANSYPSTLSGGQKQRAAIVRALSTSPKMLLFDEPTSALDPEMISEVLDVMRELANEGMTMIIVTHEMGFAREVADRIAYLENGEIVAIQPANEFFDNPQNERMRRFLMAIL